MDWQQELNSAMKPNESNILLEPFLIDCCQGLKTNPTEVKENLLSKDDIKSILSNEVSLQTVAKHIQAWIDSGKCKIN